jgi:hypothetical protein
LDIELKLTRVVDGKLIVNDSNVVLLEIVGGRHRLVIGGKSGIRESISNVKRVR